VVLNGAILPNVARIVEKRNSYRILAGMLEGKRPLVGPRRRLEDNIKMDLRKIELGGMDWIYLAQDRGHWRALVKRQWNFEFDKMRNS
jgi:hypothetical protein